MALVGLDKKWRVEKGEFRFVFSGHSDGVRDEATYLQKNTRLIDHTQRNFYAEASVE